jgi:hypothetical protein
VFRSSFGTEVVNMIITWRMAMVLCAAALLPSLAVTLAAPETPTTTVFAAASGAATRGSEHGVNKTVDGCPTTCGNLSFAYPFGIGSECSRGGDFRLICDETSRPSKLFLRDGNTEVTGSIDVGSSDHDIWTSIWRTIPMKSGTRVYNMSLAPPGRSFSYVPYISLNVTGCDLDVHWMDQMTGINRLACSTWCPSEEITEMAAKHNCSGSGSMGCCYIDVRGTQEGFQLSFVRRKSRVGASRSNQTSLLRKRITISSVWGAVFTWSIVDQPNCLTAKQNRTNYACISNHSKCHSEPEDLAYSCGCETGYTGNPYVLDGCINDKGTFFISFIYISSKDKMYIYLLLVQNKHMSV